MIILNQLYNYIKGEFNMEEDKDEFKEIIENVEIEFGEIPLKEEKKETNKEDEKTKEAWKKLKAIGEIMKIEKERMEKEEKDIENEER